MPGLAQTRRLRVGKRWVSVGASGNARRMCRKTKSYSSMTAFQRTLATLAAAALPWGVGPVAQAAPLITRVVETGGDDEATDTVTAQWTGQTFVNGVANEPLANTAADASYTVGLMAEDVPMFVDRNHQWNGATTALGIPKYLLGGEYIMSGNDNRDNAEYSLDVTISEPCYVYMLVDDRLGDTSNANPPNFPDWTADRTGDGLPDMAWIQEQGWQPVKTGWNRFGNPDWPDQIGADEGGDGVGAGAAINQWSSIYVKRFPAGTFTIGAADNTGQNMYGVVVQAVPKNPTVTKSSGDLFGFRFEVTDGSQTAVNGSSIAVTFDGAPVSPLTVSKSGDVTKIEYTAPALLPASSLHTAELKFADTGNPAATRTEILAFTVEPYGTLTPNLKVTPDTSKPGFLWRVFQNAANQDNTTAKSEQAVLGELRGADGSLLPNQADPAAQGVASGPASAPTPVTALVPFEIPGVINLSQTAGEANGNFPDDGQMPGIPGIDGTNDGIVAEVITYLELPAGLTTMGVNSDDGFDASAGQVNDVIHRIRLGDYVGGRSASDSLFRFFVQEAGVYAFRTLYEEGNGGASLEWFTLKAGGAKVLVNDVANGGVKAYRAATTPARPYVRKAFPLPGAAGVSADTSIEIEIVDASTTVESSSVALKLNGAAASPTVTKTGASTKVVLASTGLYPSNSVQTVSLTYKAGADTVEGTWTFQVARYWPLPTSLATSVGSGKDRGFRIRTVQSEAARGGSDAAAEQQLVDNGGAPNIADTSGSVDGVFAFTGVINFNQDAPTGTGNFNADNGFEDQLPLGIPGTLGGNDNFTQEVLTYLEFPTAGYYTMGVNSDDGFKVTPAEGRSTTAPVLGIFDGGRGVADTVFSLGVTQAGVYPFRLMWYENTGGAAAEWFTVNKDGARVLVNSDTAGAIKAFQARTETPKPTPTLSVARSATGLTITYTGTLQAADAVTGPYGDVPSASSPYTAASAGTAKFFRAR